MRLNLNHGTGSRKHQPLFNSLFELARVFVCLDHVATLMVNADYSVM